MKVIQVNSIAWVLAESIAGALVMGFDRPVVRTVGGFEFEIGSEWGETPLERVHAIRAVLEKP